MSGTVGGIDDNPLFSSGDQDPGWRTAAPAVGLDLAAARYLALVNRLTDQHLPSMRENSGTSSASSIAGLLV